ncbi:E3 ubiquitin-protein ligase [Tetrabaena socialis]|uniref:E3 ubiquitin-protein ligase n=1 Tax=Tetrabaena socialis TaxID=47790 RepID=A0A2J7ZLB7_9CHLO|nr:E3 ubiquitin-protein ligase [Tetrabaena socialis]|eukprot:PNH01040.1 E3 ubiquitin-protein ligase [Tetrabaena socialis]
MGAACTKRGREEAAFLKAARDGDCGVVQQAILRHVDWGYRAQTWNGQTVFHLAARYGRLDVLETVVEAVRFNPAGPDKWRKLLRMGHSTDAILRSYASLQDARCQTPLHIACIYGNADVAEALLKLGATPWSWDELGGRTPLHYAASMGHVDCVRIVLARNTPAPTGDALRRPNTARTRRVAACGSSEMKGWTAKGWE